MYTLKLFYVTNLPWASLKDDKIEKNISEEGEVFVKEMNAKWRRQWQCRQNHES